MHRRHCHDTYGAAVANVLHAAGLGIRTFDSSVAGLGGCPFAPGASGNVATEDILYALHTEGYDTGVVPHTASASDLIEYLLPLAQTGQWISGLLGKTSNSKVGQALLAKNKARTTSKLWQQRHSTDCTLHRTIPPPGSSMSLVQIQAGKRNAAIRMCQLYFARQ